MIYFHMPGRKLQGRNDFSSAKKENVAKGFWQRSHRCQVGAPPECKDGARRESVVRCSGC